MKKLFSLLTTLLLALSLVGCGGEADEGNQGKGEAGEKVFTYAIGGEPQPLDPSVASDSVSTYINNQVYLPLFEIGHDGQMVEVAVDTYTVSEDALTYTFKLKEGLKWSNGDPLLAEHYEYAAKRSLGLGTADSYYSYFIKDYVKGAKELSGADIADMDGVMINALDDVTLEMVVNEPTPFFTGLLAAGVFTAVHPDYAPEHDYLYALEVGFPVSGGFMPVSIDTSSEIVLKKNPYFYRADEVTLDKLVALVMPDQNAQLVAFQTGEIDMATSLASDVTKIYEGKPELQIENTVLNYYCMTNINDTTGSKALQNVDVRRALQLGVDRGAIVKALDADEVYYELYGFVPKGIAGVNGDFRTEQDEAEQLVYYDLQEAKTLMEKAGYTTDKPLELEYYYNQNAMHDIVAQVIQAQWKEIGVNLTLRTGELRVFFDDRDSLGSFELARGAMSADYMDPNGFLKLAVGDSQTVRTWGDEKYDGMMKAANAEPDPAKRLKMMHEAENYVVRDQAMTNPLFGYKVITLVREGVTGIEMNPQGNGSLMYVKLPE